MREKEQFNIFLLMDDNYVYYSLPFMYSLIKNNLTWAEIVFHIVSDNLSKEYRTILSNFSKENGAEVFIYEVDTSIFKTLKYSARYPALLYYKLVPHLILPANIDKAIFFDVDMVCAGRLEDLYHIDLKDKRFAMCYGIQSFKEFANGITDGINANYHNSGMMVCNLKQLREDKITIDTYINYSKHHQQGNLFEEFFLNNYFYGKILSLMPFDYNFNVGGRNIYADYCKKNGVIARKAIFHYLPFRNDSPIIKPWDAYEYFFENKRNTIFSADIWEIYKKWWDYALQLDPQDLLPIIDKAKGNKYARSIRLDRDKWRTYSDTFKYLAINNLLLLNSDEKMHLANALISKGYKRIAIYGDTEIAKVLCAVLKDSDVSIEYIVENALNPVPGFKTINRNAAEYLDCDVMLVADIYNFKEIKAKLEKMKVPFPFYNAAEFIQSLPAADGDGINKIKEKIRNLNDRIVFEREEKERLDIQLSASAKREAELAEKVGTLTKRDTVSQEKIKSLSVDIKQLTATNKRVTEERDNCIGELESVKNSLSFKLGRFITFIPRKIRDAFKKSKK